MTPAPAGDRRPSRLAARLGVAAGAASAACGATLWLTGQFLPFAPPVHTWVLAAAATLAIASLVQQLLGRWSWSGGPLAALGLVLAIAFFGVLAGPVRISARAVDPAEQATAPRKPQRLRVVSYNVLHGYPRFTNQEARFSGLAQALEQLSPDVALFQEAWCTQRHGCLINRLATGQGPFVGYHLAYAPVNGSLRLIGFEEGLAVASRWPIERVTVDVLRPRERPWRRRAVLQVTLRLDGETWTFATAHLADRDAGARRAQASSLATRLPAAGTLVLGADLNDPRGSPTVSALDARGLEPLLGGARDHLLVRELPVGWAVTEARWLLAPDETGSPAGLGPISDHPAAWLELARGETRETEGRRGPGA
ncbi:MAG TPA: endonuclease/exonuclease/phosphatase family protein [Thermoanaerobaculia bacterium]|nr:endonuclease/exonuclease/phosphatase family protein [Thermoanaerobaculia bacterium]